MQDTWGDAVNRVNFLAEKWAGVVALTSSRLPPEGYFEEHAPYLDVLPLRAFQRASQHLSQIFRVAEANAGRFAWDSDYEEEVFEKINEATESIIITKAGIDRYTDLWTKIEISKEYLAGHADALIDRVRNKAPFSPV
ncbi:MAG: hypothetical protein JWO78_953 [Micavibrio sp.]|nr:hypothetical protein [Micavibrio sp.]